MKLHELKKQQEQSVRLEPCVECGKPIVDGYFGRWGDGGVCSKTCDILHMQQRRPYGPGEGSSRQAQG